MNDPAPTSIQNKESQYIKTIAITLKRINKNQSHAAKDITYLQNMLQGFLINYFYTRLGEYLYASDGIVPDNRFLVALSHVLSIDVFPGVRKTFNQNEGLVLSVCRTIVNNARRDRSDRFKCDKNIYIRVFNKLCPDAELKTLQGGILKNTEIRKILLQFRFEKNIQNKELRTMFKSITENEDPHIILPLFSRYMRVDKTKRLISMVTGGWQIEADFLRNVARRQPTPGVT